MVDITDFKVDDDSIHSHVAIIDDERIPIDLLSQQDYSSLISEISNEEDREYHIEERIPEIFMPYIKVFHIEPAQSTMWLQAILKRLYNSFAPICVLHDPNSEYYILVANDIRINKEQHLEILSSFSSLCDYRRKEFKSETLQYLPLTWQVEVYKDGSQMNLDVSLGEHPIIALSHHSEKKPLSIRSKVNSKNATKDALVDSILMYSRQEIKSDRIKASELITLISMNRSQQMHMFLTIGRCLYRIFSGDGEGLDLWRSCTYPESQSLCDEYWDTLSTTSTYYTIHTLQKWAMEDSPEKYKEWNSVSVRAYLEAAVMPTGGPSDVAGVAYAKDPVLFICDGDDSKDAKFYRFNGTYYEEVGNFVLQDYLEKEVIPEFEDYSKDLSKMIEANPNNQYREMIQEKVKACIKIIRSLKTNAYQMEVIKSLMRRFNKKGFDKVRDQNPHLTAFEDCILDVSPDFVKDAYESKDILRCIRKGMPEDYITVSTGYSFLQEAHSYTWESEQVQDILQDLNRFETNPEKREFLDRTAASSLFAGNLRKRKLMMAGPTNNGKSMYCSLWEHALGPHYYPSNIGSNLLYSSDISPNQARGDMWPLRFARILPQTEITDSHVMNESFVKRITGKVDSISFRGLYQSKNISFVPRFLPVTICNTMPKLNGNSKALRTRIIIYRMNSKFISETDEEWNDIKNLDPVERQRVMQERSWFFADPNYEQFIKRTYKAFMWIMIQNYIKYANIDEQGIVAPGKLPKPIILDTLQFFKNSNLYLQFMEQATTRGEGSHGISTYAMYSAYKRWYSDNIAKFGFVSYQKFLEELAEMNIKPIDDIFRGFTLKYREQ